MSGWLASWQFIGCLVRWNTQTLITIYNERNDVRYLASFQGTQNCEEPPQNNELPIHFFVKRKWTSAKYLV